VALKFLPLAFAKSPAWIARLRQEARLARTVTHPNVCRIFDLVESDGECFLTMEYVDGEDLASLYRRIGRLPIERAIEVSRQICLGLAVAHQHKVIHRDLKPPNIMIDGSGNVRITDFGIAAIAGEIQPSEIRTGTAAYMAPEQITGRGVSVQSDLYSLGLVMFELFTGRRAFQAETVDEYADLHMNVAPISLQSARVRRRALKSS
jgi:serine/threonine-protein kinase